MSLFGFTDGAIVGLGRVVEMSISQPISCTGNPNTTFSEPFVEAENPCAISSIPMI